MTDNWGLIVLFKIINYKFLGVYICNLRVIKSSVTYPRLAGLKLFFKIYCMQCTKKIYNWAATRV